VNSTKHTQKKRRLRDRTRTDTAWFSCLLRHPARKRSGSVRSTRSPQGVSTRHATPNRCSCRTAVERLTSITLVDRRRVRKISETTLDDLTTPLAAELSCLAMCQTLSSRRPPLPSSSRIRGRVPTPTSNSTTPESNASHRSRGVVTLRSQV